METYVSSTAQICGLAYYGLDTRQQLIDAEAFIETLQITFHPNLYEFEIWTYVFSAHFTWTVCAEGVKNNAEMSTDLCGNIIQDAEMSFSAHAITKGKIFKKAAKTRLNNLYF